MQPSTDIGVCSPVTLLGESVERYLILKGVDKKKYFAKYMVAAGEAWKDIFQKTLWATQSVWKELKDDSPYPSIDIPSNKTRIFSASVTDECGKIQPLYYNSQLNVIPRPTQRNCSCAECNCDMCGDISAVSVTTKELFTISGITYYQKTWLKYCTNGDILEYAETPTKKYNDFIGDGGDYNDDYSDDYSTGGNPLANFSIETVISQRKICTLATKPCGCPQQTEENECMIRDYCGLLLPLFSCRRKKYCNQFLENVNNNYYGEVKISECGTKMFYKPSRFWKRDSQSKYPDFLLLNYQTSGLKPDQEAQVPEYAESCLWAGTDWYTIRFNRSYSLSEREVARTEYEREQNDVIKYLNPLSLEHIYNLQATPIKW
jgi:hypothetical protein